MIQIVLSLNLEMASKLLALARHSLKQHRSVLELREDDLAQPLFSGLPRDYEKGGLYPAARATLCYN